MIPHICCIGVLILDQLQFEAMFVFSPTITQLQSPNSEVTESHNGEKSRYDTGVSVSKETSL